MNDATPTGTEMDVKALAAAAVGADPMLRRFLARLLAFEESYIRQFLAHGARLSELQNPSESMVTDAFVTLHGATAGRVAAIRYRSWLEERHDLLQAYYTELEQTLAAVPWSPVHDDFVAATAGEAPGDAMTMARDLETAECAHVDALLALYNWCIQESGKFGEMGGQLAFLNHEQQDAWVALMAALRTAEAGLDRANEVFEPAQAVFQKTTYEWLARARVTLGNR